MRCNGLSVAPLFYAIMRLEGSVVIILYIRLKTLSSQSLWLKRKKQPHTPWCMGLLMVCTTMSII